MAASASKKINHILCIAVCACFAGAANANPTDPVVVNGSVSFSAPDSQTLNITNTPGAIINWNGFSISSGELTRFIQQSQDSAVLNRVTGQNPSQILGSLQSNGQVFLINPNGMVFGPSATVNTASFYASTLDMSDQDFLAGRHHYEGSTGSIVVQDGAVITAEKTDGGNVWLIANQTDVQPGAQITADKGNVALVAGSKFSVVDDELGNLTFEVVADGTNTLAQYGEIAANQGLVALLAGDIDQAGSVTANGGVIQLESDGRVRQAGSLQSNDGKVWIYSGDRVDNTGDLTANRGSVLIGAEGTINHSGSARADNGSIQLISNDSVNIAGDVNARYAYVSANNTVNLRPDSTVHGEDGVVVVADQVNLQRNSTVSANGKHIGLDANDIYMADGSLIQSSGIGAASGGSVTLYAHNGIRLDAGAAIRATGGTGGRINLNGHRVSVADLGALSARGDSAGDHGSVSIIERGLVNYLIESDVIPGTEDGFLATSPNSLQPLAEGGFMHVSQTPERPDMLRVTIYDEAMSATGEVIDVLVGGYSFAQDIEELSNGNLAVSWYNWATSSAYTQIIGRDGEAISPVTLLGVEFSMGGNSLAPLAATDDGGYIVATSDLSVNSIDRNLFVRRFDAAGNQVGGTVELGEGSTSLLFPADIERTQDGDYLIAFSSYNQQEMKQEGSMVVLDPDLNIVEQEVGIGMASAYSFRSATLLDGSVVSLAPTYETTDGVTHRYVEINIADPDLGIVKTLNVDSILEGTGKYIHVNSVVALDNGGFAVDYSISNNGFFPDSPARSDLHYRVFDSQGNQVGDDLVLANTVGDFSYGRGLVGSDNASVYGVASQRPGPSDYVGGNAQRVSLNAVYSQADLRDRPSINFNRGVVVDVDTDARAQSSSPVVGDVDYGDFYRNNSRDLTGGLARLNAPVQFRVNDFTESGGLGGSDNSAVVLLDRDAGAGKRVLRNSESDDSIANGLADNADSSEEDSAQD